MSVVIAGIIMGYVFWILSVADAIQIELNIFDVILTSLFYGRYVCKYHDITESTTQLQL